MGGSKNQAVEFEASLGDGGNSIWSQDSSTGNLVIAFMAVTLDGDGWDGQYVENWVSVTAGRVSTVKQLEFDYAMMNSHQGYQTLPDSMTKQVDSCRFG